MAKRGSFEWKLNIGKGNKGKIAWNKGKRGLQVSWLKGKKRWWYAPGSFKKGQMSWNKGKVWNDEIKKKISDTKKGRPNYKNRGKNHYNWKNGKTELNEQIRQSLEYRNWRRAVFERDDYTCQECGIKNMKGLGKTIKLEVDHIKQFAFYPELRFEVFNGRTLCLDCHHLIGAKERRPNADCKW